MSRQMRFPFEEGYLPNFRYNIQAHLPAPLPLNCGLPAIAA